MTIYDSLTHNGVNYFLIDTFQPTDTICVGDVYLPLSSNATPGSCTFMYCGDCRFEALCTSDDNSKRIQIASELFPNLLTNFPELGV